MTEQSIQNERHSARAFSNKTVDAATIKAIVAEALRAPSWENSQPVHVYVATGATAQALREHHTQTVNSGQKSWADLIPPKDNPDFMDANIDRWLDETQQAMGPDAMQTFGEMGAKLYDAPVLVYLTVPKTASMYSAYDAGAFGYGILLAATARGLSGVPAYQLVRYPEEIRAQFSIPDNESLMMGMAIGYPAPAPINDLRTTRRPVEDVLQLKD